jgi:hypothetical protein
MKIKLPLLYSQYDNRWGAAILGFNSDPKYNIYNYGCLISCLAMLCRYYGYDETPLSINDKLMNLGKNVGFTDGSGNYVWGAITKLKNNITERVTNTPEILTDEQMNLIKNSIDKQNPVMIQIDVNPRTVANETHYVLVVDYNTADENDLTIADPLGGIYRSLKEYLGWFRPTARKTIEKYILYTGPLPVNQDETLLVPKEVFENLVHGSTEWDKTVQNILPDSNPKITDFETVNKVIAGYKSRITDLGNKIVEGDANIALLKQDIENVKSKLAVELDECHGQIKILTGQLDVANTLTIKLQELEGQYQGNINDLQSKLITKENELAKTKSNLALCENHQEQKVKIIDMIINVLSKLKEIIFKRHGRYS